ncbi:MAG: hypothetical protein ABI863_07320 [Ginsengibacter sp.]
MSIDKISLPAFLYRDMFGKNLVDLKTGIPENSLNEELKINFLGGNEKKIIFLFNDHQNKFLADVQMKFLYDLLKACELTMGDIALVNYFHNNTITHRELMVQLQPRKILVFGITAGDLDLPFNIPFFQMQNFGEQAYMISPSIEEVQMNIELKKQLWACLQKFFNIRKQK